MGVVAARAALSLPTNFREWPNPDWQAACVPSAFVNVSYGDDTGFILENLNSIITEPVALRIQRKLFSAANEHLVFHGREERIPLASTRDDSMVAIISLNKVLQPDYELRLGRYTIGNSELTFLPLHPTDWQSLAAEFGPDHLNHVYAPLPASAAEFFAKVDQWELELAELANRPSSEQ